MEEERNERLTEGGDFFENPQGLTLTDRARWHAQASLALLDFFCAKDLIQYSDCKNRMNLYTVDGMAFTVGDLVEKDDASNVYFMFFREMLHFVERRSDFSVDFVSCLGVVSF